MSRTITSERPSTPSVRCAPQSGIHATETRACHVVAVGSKYAHRPRASTASPISTAAASTRGSRGPSTTPAPSPSARASRASRARNTMSAAPMSGQVTSAGSTQLP